MHIWTKFISEQIMTNSRCGKNDRSDITIHSGKNMSASCLVCLRHEGDFTVTHISADENTPEGVSFRYNFRDNIIYNDGVPYPDILSGEKEKSVLAHTTCSVVVSFDVSQDASAGKVMIPVKFTTNAGEYTAKISLVIHNVTLPEPADSDFGHEYFFTARGYFPMNAANAKSPDAVIRYSDKWEELMTNYAKAMKYLRVNTLWMPIVEFLADAGSKRVAKDKWEFDFSLVDKTLDIFLKNGSFKYVAITGSVSPVDGNNIQSIDENGALRKFDIPSEDADIWAEVYYTAIYNYFKERNILHMLRVHLQDEPHKTVHWKWLRDICRKVMPDIVCGEPLDIHDMSEELDGYADWFVPRLEVYQQDPVFYHKQVKNGKELWVYSCCFPEDNWWLNKFVDLPYAYSRFIKYACFSQNITGFLHWGFNFIDSVMYGIKPQARFKGDGHIIYPDEKNNDVLMSMRGLETKDGLQDWELLNMLRKINPKAAYTIANSVAQSFTDYTQDLAAPEKAREQILNMLD